MTAKARITKSGGWASVTLASEVKFLSGGTPNMDTPRYWGGDIPWVSSGEMKQRRISSTSQTVTEQGAREGSKLVPERTVLAVVRGMSLAKEFRVAITQCPVTFNQDLKALVPSERLLPEFLFYYLLSQNGPIRDSASESGHGTKKLDTRVLEDWPLPLPPLPIQRKIAAILSAYDELIETHQRRIALLEKLAEEIYREWFVRLRFPGHEKVKKIKGLPEGWSIQSLGELIAADEASLQTGPFGTYLKASDYTASGTPVINVRNIGMGNLKPDKLEYLPETMVHKLAQHVLKNGDIVFGRKGAVERHLLITKSEDGWIQGSDCIRLRLNQTPVSPSFLSMGFRQTSHQEWMLNNCSSGATMASLNERILKRLNFLLPPHALATEFDSIIDPIFSQTTSLDLQITHLTRTRDLLLPRLISGKLSVEDLDIEFPPGMAEGI